MYPPPVHNQRRTVAKCTHWMMICPCRVYALAEECSLICAADTSGEHLRELRDACLEIVATFTKDYIWQREAPTLHSSIEQRPPWKPEDQARANSQPTSTLGSFEIRKSTSLWGATRFGDNVEDEWFITWLLFEITRWHLWTSALLQCKRALTLRNPLAFGCASSSQFLLQAQPGSSSQGVGQ